MLENLKIENFRGFQSFELQQLGRVNLLVGQNNSGKTSILEAIQLLCSRTNLESLYQILERRGEFIQSNEFQGIEIRYAQIRHLFYGHEIALNSQFSISGKRGNNSEKIKVSIGTRSSEHRSTNECWKSLASIACQENAHEEGGITIQRIEPDKPSAIAFNEREIVIAAERDIEVR